MWSDRWIIHTALSLLKSPHSRDKCSCPVPLPVGFHWTSRSGWDRSRRSRQGRLIPCRDFCSPCVLEHRNWTASWLGLRGVRVCEMSWKGPVWNVANFYFWTDRCRFQRLCCPRWQIVSFRVFPPSRFLPHSWTEGPSQTYFPKLVDFHWGRNLESACDWGWSGLRWQIRHSWSS